MNETLKKGLAFFIFQFILTNALLIGELHMYYMLPRYINTIVGVFLGPIILFIALTVLYNNFFQIENENLLVSIAITIITFIIPIMVAVNINSIADFIYLVKNNNIIEASITDLNKTQTDGYLKIKDSQILSNQYGITYIHHSSGKNSKGYTEPIYTIPVVPKDWENEQPVSFWIFDNSSNYIIKREIDIKEILSGNFKYNSIEGTQLTDPFDIYNAKESMNIAIKKYGLNASEHPKFLSMHKSYESALERGKKHFLIYISIVYILYIFFPTILFYTISIKELRI